MPENIRRTTLDRLRSYAEMLLTWNREASNLISHNDERRIVERHLRECIEPWTWLAESGARRWIDLGSGAGLPALPLVLVGVESHWTLVESRRTKTLFLRKVAEQLQLDGVKVVLGRLETLIEERSLEGDYDGFTSRATMRIGPTLSLATSIVRPGGCAFLWKGGRRDEEMQEDPSWAEAWNLLEVRPTGTAGAVVCKFERK